MFMLMEKQLKLLKCMNLKRLLPCLYPNNHFTRNIILKVTNTETYLDIIPSSQNMQVGLLKKIARYIFYHKTINESLYQGFSTFDYLQGRCNSTFLQNYLCPI